MYPDFSYLFHDLFGSSFDNGFSVIKTYGFVLVVAFGLSGRVLFLELGRMYRREILARSRRNGMLPQDHVLPILVIAAVSGVLGARILSILESPSAFFAHPLRVFFVTGGMTFYGGFILAAISIYVYLVWHRVNIFRFLDAAAPALFVGYGVGRLACHFSGDGDWGVPNDWTKPFFLPDWLWAYDYPHNIAQRGILMPDCSAKYCHVLPSGVFPSSVYEFLMAMAFFLLLWSLRKHVKTPGVLFAGFLLLNGLARFLIEFVRVNAHYTFLGVNLSLSQYIALGLVGAGLILWIWLVLKKSYQEA